MVELGNERLVFLCNVSLITETLVLAEYKRLQESPNDLDRTTRVTRL